MACFVRPAPSFRLPEKPGDVPLVKKAAKVPRLLALGVELLKETLGACIVKLTVSTCSDRWQ